jgi:hypothetical protein
MAITHGRSRSAYVIPDRGGGSISSKIISLVPIGGDLPQPPQQSKSSETALMPFSAEAGCAARQQG